MHRFPPLHFFLLLCVLLSLVTCRGTNPSSPKNPPHQLLKPTAPTDLDRATIEFYAQWKEKYLGKGCGDDRYYISVQHGGDSQGGGMAPNSISISEGHGYGMMIVAALGKRDPQAHQIFDGLYRFFKAHPSPNASHLMSWNQVQGCQDSTARGSATDGDIDIAFALLVAHKQWGSAGPLNYLEEALLTIDAIWNHETTRDGSWVLLGDWVRPDNGEFYPATRSSDLIVDHFRAFAKATSNVGWNKLVDNSLKILSTVQNRFSKDAGLVPDFITGLPKDARPAPPEFLESFHDGSYSYNACRLPWRLATDVFVNHDPASFDVLGKLNAWFLETTHGDPSRIHGGYDLNGTPHTEENPMAFIAPIALSASVEGRNQAWVDALWNAVLGKDIQSEDYFGNTLKLLSLIVGSGNWVDP